MSIERENTQFKHSKKVKKPAWRKVLIIVLAVLLCVLIGLGGFVGYNVVKLLGGFQSEEVTDPDIVDVETIDKEIVNIALFGIDTREGEAAFSGNSDSIMILSVNTKTGSIKLMSVMRDSYLPIVKDIDENGEPVTYNYKVNAAYANGGPERAIKTLNHNFGLDIKNYATVNFQGMAEIIDAIGGIDVEVRRAEIYANNGLNQNIREQCDLVGLSANDYLVHKAGVQTLNGIQAVAWARIRSVATTDGVNNDHGRTDRQRYVMEQILNKVLEISPSEYSELAKVIMPHVKTSLSAKEALKLAMSVLTKKISFSQTRVPHKEYTITDNASTKAGSSVYYDPDDAKAVIHAYVYENIEPEVFLETYTPEKKDWANIR